MCATLDDLTLIEHQDFVEALHFHQPVGNHQRGFSIHGIKERIEQGALGQRIKVGRRFVQNKNGGIFE